MQTLAAIITILLELYRDIFRTLAYLMSETYLKPCQKSTMSHIENSGIVKVVYSGIFRDIQGHSAIFKNAQT